MDNVKTFEELGLDENSLYALKKKGFEEPSPIQSLTIPILIDDNCDVIGQAQTGTGKTAAFALPIIEKLKSKSNHIQALILTPTRELAIQVSEEINSLLGKRRYRIMPIYGGQSIETQFRRLSRGVDIVVGTPGRIIDHINRGTLDLSKISHMVLDEADEMLNMGFIDDVETIMKTTPSEKRVALFSATMPDRIKQLSKKYMGETKIVQIKSSQVTTDLTEQIYFEVLERDKFEALCRIIDTQKEFYGLIFCRTKIDVDNVTNRLIDRGYGADCIHGDISQHQRERILNKFKGKKSHILVATDVAARGLDISDLTHVINFSLPQDPESYVHRIGRTGRAGKKGIAITFITPSEYRKLSFIKRIAKTDIQKKKVPEINEIIDIKKGRIISEIKKIIEADIEEIYKEIADQLIQGDSERDIINALVKVAYSNELDTANYGNVSYLNSQKHSPDEQGKTRLFVSLGKRNGYTPKKLVDFIKENVSITDKDINEIVVLDEFSFVTVPFEQAEDLLMIFKKSAQGSKPLISKAKQRSSNESSERGSGRKNFSRGYSSRGSYSDRGDRKRR